MEKVHLQVPSDPEN